MKYLFAYGRLSMLTILILTSGFFKVTEAQTVMPLPAHGSIYSGNSRGFWFTAPVDFVITGIRAPLEINTNAQSIHLVKFTAGPPPEYSSTTTAFITLYYGSNIAGTNFVPMNIPIDSGALIGVLAVRDNGTGGSMTSYATPTGPYTSYIGSYPVIIKRMGWQGNIISSAAVDLYQVSTGTVGRAEIQYVLSQPTDAGLESFINIPDTICSGINPVTVSLKNFGPNTLDEAKINWKVNNVVQATFSWNGSLSVNSSANVTIGSYLFQTGITYDIVAYVSDVNNGIDTVPGNDTIQKTGIWVKPSPGITLNDTAHTMCQGDSIEISGTLTGSPPWDITLYDGTGSIQFNNLPIPGFSFWLSPASTKTYTVTQIADATGCIGSDSVSFVVAVVPQPPSVITPMGSTAGCMGDSVMLMANIGLNFTYQWMKDGSNIPGGTSYVLVAKEAGSYTVRVISPNGCSTISPPVNVIFHALPVVFLGNDTNLAPGAHITLDAGPGFNSYNWSTGATSQTLYVDTAGHGLGIQTIWVAVLDNNYCTGRDTIRINFVHNPGIAEGYTDATVRIIPNPTDGKFKLHLAGFSPGTMNLQLYSHDSRLVYESSIVLKHPTERITVDPGKLSDGIYILKITGQQGTVSRRVVVSR